MYRDKTPISYFSGSVNSSCMVTVLAESQSVVIFKYLDHLRISGYGDGGFILEGLDPHATYRVWMKSNSRQGSSKPSESVYGRTHQPCTYSLAFYLFITLTRFLYLLRHEVLTLYL